MIAANDVVITAAYVLAISAAITAATTPLTTAIAALTNTVAALTNRVTALETEVTNLGDEITTLTNRITDLENTVNAMKTKTDYINIYNNDFYMVNLNHRIILQCNEFVLTAGDAINNGYIIINDSNFNINHTITNITSSSRFSISKVLCDDITVLYTASLPQINSWP